MVKRSRLSKAGSKARSQRLGKVNAGNLVNFIMEYESGNISDKNYLEMFSYLIKTGQAWSLQGSLYGRPARDLIVSGVIDKSGKIDWEKVEEMRME